MSSLEVTPNLSSSKRVNILARSSSFQKFKCSATYQFHLAGSKLSKESLTQLFEKVVTQSRTLMHIAFVVLALPTVKVFTMVMLWSLDLLAKVFGLNLVIEKQSSGKLQTSKNGILVRIRCTFANIKSTHDVPKHTFDDTIENRLKRKVPQIFSSNLLETITKFRLNNEHKQYGYLSVGVYAGVAFAYLQLAILIVALNVFTTPPGLVFLSVSLVLIGLILFKIFLNTETSRSEPISPPRPTSPERFRISRSSNRRYLEFHEKTLSKIRLL